MKKMNGTNVTKSTRVSHTAATIKIKTLDVATTERLPAYTD